MRRAFLAVLLLGSVAAAPLSRSLFASADPDAEVIGGEYWIFPTGGRGDRLVAWASPDLATWRMRGVLIKQSDIGWIKADGAPKHYLWAPDMVADGGRWLLYYSVGPQDPTLSRIGVAVCVAPQGPCADSGKPLLTGGRGFEAIDPMVFRDPKSKLAYLYAGGSNGARLKLYELTPELTGIVRELPVAQPRFFTEAPFVHERGGTYYLSYSAGRWQTAEYSVHYATGPSPAGPWTYRGPILLSSLRFKGPGHHSFITDPATGSTLIAYHRWERQQGNGPYAGERRIAIAPVAYAPDGSILPVRMSD